MNYTTISVEDDGPIRTIRLNRPERRNAMSPEMQDELIAALEDSAGYGGCRVLVLGGLGQAFCSGLDLTVFDGMKNQPPTLYRADAERVGRLFRTLYEMPMPTIAAVHGAAIAGGAGLAITCDFTIALNTARFGFTEARFGVVPALVSVFLSLQLGEKRTRDLLLTARIFNAEQACAMGLVNEVLPPAEPLAHRVRELAQALMANSPQSLTATKRLMAAQNRVRLDAALAIAVEASIRARETADFKEGVSAFLEKRKAVWKNERV